MVQLQSIAVTVIWTAVASVVILMIARAIGGLRVDEQTEVDGLDLAEHGERGYPSS
jgi:Amt family ammonium transporter